VANFTQEANASVESSEGSGFSDYVAKLFDPSLTWEDVKWLMGYTKLPVVLKGILTAEDAKIAASLGVAGIIVSNHGARQLDSSPATVSVYFFD
jgi:(S)-2-hydroxy-acid oxidase